MRARKLELEIDEAEGRLISVDQVKRVLSSHIVEARTKLEGLVERLVVLLPQKLKTRLRDEIDRVVRDTCRDLADADRGVDEVARHARAKSSKDKRQSKARSKKRKR